MEKRKIKCPHCNNFMYESECYDYEDMGDNLWHLSLYQCPYCKKNYIVETLMPIGEPKVLTIEEDENA